MLSLMGMGMKVVRGESLVCNVYNISGKKYEESGSRDFLECSCFNRTCHTFYSVKTSTQFSFLTPRFEFRT